MLNAIHTRLRRFVRDTAGNMTLETVIWMPLMILVLGATFSFYEAFRQKSLNTKAAFTIADALSRETDPVDDQYLDGMLELLEFLTTDDTYTSASLSSSSPDYVRRVEEFTGFLLSLPRWQFQ